MKTRIVWSKPSGSGRRTGWARTVRELDRSRVGAKALVGEYLQDEVETEIEVGTLVVQISPVGSVKNGFDGAMLYRVSAAGELEPCACSQDGRYWDWRKQWLSIADAIAEELNATTVESLNAESDRLTAAELGLPETAYAAFDAAHTALASVVETDRALVLAKLVEAFGGQA